MDSTPGSPPKPKYHHLYEVFLNPLPGSLMYLLKEFFLIAEILQNKMKQSQVYIPILQLSQWFDLYIVDTTYYVWL